MSLVLRRLCRQTLATNWYKSLDRSWKIVHLNSFFSNRRWQSNLCQTELQKRRLTNRFCIYQDHSEHLARPNQFVRSLREWFGPLVNQPFSSTQSFFFVQVNFVIHLHPSKSQQVYSWSASFGRLPLVCHTSHKSRAWGNSRWTRLYFR